MGACLQADAVWAQASSMVQILGDPIQVPVQPVETELVSPGGTGQKRGAGRVERLEGGDGVVGEPSFLNPSWHLFLHCSA